MVKVPGLRRRQCENAVRSNTNAQPQLKLATESPPPANQISSESVSQLSSSYVSSHHLSLRSSSQVSTLHPSQSEEESTEVASDNIGDIEMGSNKSKDKSSVVQSQSSKHSSSKSSSSPSSSSMETEQSETAPPSVVSWPKNLPIPFEVKTSQKTSKQSVGNNENNSRQNKSRQLQRQSLSNAMVDQASELTHSSATTNSTFSGQFRPKEAYNWGLPSDPRALPVYLMPLAVLPLVCLVVLIMAGILIGMVIESYFWLLEYTMECRRDASIQEMIEATFLLNNMLMDLTDEILKIKRQYYT